MNPPERSHSIFHLYTNSSALAGVSGNHPCTFTRPLGCDAPLSTARLLRFPAAVLILSSSQFWLAPGRRSTQGSACGSPPRAVRHTGQDIDVWALIPRRVSDCVHRSAQKAKGAAAPAFFSSTLEKSCQPHRKNTKRDCLHMFPRFAEPCRQRD